MGKDKLFSMRAAQEYIEANWPYDPLLRRIGLNLLEQIPEAEGAVVPLRCVECRYSMTISGKRFCGRSCGMPEVTDDGYCDRGERRERCRWQEERPERVAAVEISRASSEQEISGTATGERRERCRWQEE